MISKLPLRQTSLCVAGSCLSEVLLSSTGICAIPSPFHPVYHILPVQAKPLAPAETLQWPSASKMDRKKSIGTNLMSVVESGHWSGDQ